MAIIFLFSSRCLIMPMLGLSRNLLIHGMFLITMRSSKTQWVRICLEACSQLLLSEIDIILFLVTSSPGICFWWLFLVQVVCFALISYVVWFHNLGSMINECENVMSWCHHQCVFIVVWIVYGEDWLLISHLNSFMSLKFVWRMYKVCRSKTKMCTWPLFFHLLFTWTSLEHAYEVY